MRFLITGGAGFIWSRIVDALTTRGGEVVIVDDLGLEELGRRQPEITALTDLTGWTPPGVSTRRSMMLLRTNEADVCPVCGDSRMPDEARLRLAVSVRRVAGPMHWSRKDAG